VVTALQRAKTDTLCCREGLWADRTAWPACLQTLACTTIRWSPPPPPSPSHLHPRSWLTPWTRAPPFPTLTCTRTGLRSSRGSSATSPWTALLTSRWVARSVRPPVPGGATRAASFLGNSLRAACPLHRALPSMLCRAGLYRSSRSCRRAGTDTHRRARTRRCGTLRRPAPWRPSCLTTCTSS